MTTRVVLRLFVLVGQAIAQNTLRSGVAAVSITPPNGTPLVGYYRKRLSEGVLDELYAKAIVFEQSGAKAAVVICDVLTLPRHTIVTARQLIEANTGSGELLVTSALQLLNESHK